MHESIHQQHEQHQQDGEAHDEQAEAVGADLEGRRRRLAGQAVGDGADGGAGARFDHPHPGAAADDGGAHEHGVGGVLQIGRIGGQRTRAFLDRIGFAGQQCLLDEKIARLQHQTVRRNHIARGEHGEVAGDDFDHRHLQRLAVADHPGPHRYRVAQAFRRFAGPVLLDEIQRDAEQHHHRDDEKVGHFAGQGGNRTGGEQKNDQGILEAGEELQPQGPFRVIAEQVGAKSGEPRTGLGAG